MLQNIIAEIYRPSCGFSYRNVQKWVERVEQAAGRAGLSICDLKPLAELLGCEQRVSDIKLAVRELQVQADNSFALGYFGRTRDCKRLVLDMAAIARALNWERTEFDTLDQLLAAIREQEQHHSNFVGLAIRDDERIDKVRELLCLLAETLGSTPLLDEAIELLEPRKGGHIPARAPMRVVDVNYNFPCSLKPVPATHTLLHAGELYRDVTILLRTEQLVAWRTADGQEYSAVAHQVPLDPDEDGLAAELLSRIAGVEIAPEHMAELRAQMGVTHG